LYCDSKTFQYKPTLATSYKLANNNTFELDLSKDVKFNNGTGFDVEDVVATFNHVTA
jgi:peptide/nickel transport system substrate-binding protein